RRFVLEGEVDVAGIPGTAVGDFPFDPHVAEPGFEHAPDCGGQLRDGEHLAPGLRLTGHAGLVLFEGERKQIRHELTGRALESPQARRSPAPRDSTARLLWPC